MGTAGGYNSLVHKELEANAAWFPVTNTFKLGDYGLISGGVFTPLGNIDEFEVGFETGDGAPSSLDFSSEGTSMVRVAGGVEVTAFPEQPIEAKLAIEFKNESSFLVKAGTITTRQIQNVNQVAKQLRKADGWERKFRVVWTTLTGVDCAVVTSRGANARFELSGKADALRVFELGKVDAGVTVASEQNVGFKSLGKSGVLALRLFKLKLFSGDPKFLETKDEDDEEVKDATDLVEKTTDDEDDV
jgi:hypothetical protein